MTDILGLDLSLTATGVSTDGAFCGVLRPKTRGVERLAAIVDAVVPWAAGRVVVLEGYSFASRGRAIFDLGELGGVIRLELHRRGIPFAVVPPSVLKRFACGRGNAPKDAMLAAAIRRFGFPGEDNNEADAHLLRAMGEMHYGAGPEPTAYQAEALAKVEWPDLEGKGVSI